MRKKVEPGPTLPWGPPSEPMGQELGVVGSSGLGEQHQGAQTGPETELVQRAKSLCWIKEHLCSHAPLLESSGTFAAFSLQLCLSFRFSF